MDKECLAMIKLVELEGGDILEADPVTTLLLLNYYY
jgi:hypothetical protein